MAAAPSPRRPTLRARLPGGPLAIWGAILFLGVIALAVTWQFVEPAPPRQVTLATGAPGGAYEQIGAGYAEWFADKGITLETVATQGATENWQRLLAGEVDAAIVQGGTAPAGAGDQLEGLVSVAYEPLFVFYREDALNAAHLLGGDPPVPQRLETLSGLRIAIGSEGSGTRTLVRTLLDELGLATDDATDTALVAIGGEAAARGLLEGKLGAAAFVMSPTAPLVQRLLAAEGIGVLNQAQAPTFTQRLPYLATVTLHEGVVDPRRNLPPHRVQMLAPATYLVTRKDTHRAIAQLLVEAEQRSRRIHLVGNGDQFPSLAHMDIPVSDQARYFFQRGPGFLHRHLPFWAASLVDRLAILIIPLLTIIIPLVRIAPAAVTWSMRRRIFRWYRQLRVIDEELGRPQLPVARLESNLAQLKQLDHDVSGTEVPLSYMEEFYNLRLHIAYMRQRVRERLGNSV
ncbi:CmpA/NrtA family ABC transporter substrate-binding protein [Alkalilimnicola ehrlichii MLHE-1]|uniref:TRAP transporter solute receptor, TAXI family n=1 Tax=Alkalilimnicola ehrlichii (strain ATCC BAA-1101 / DSM 17681 / MLHE-1) TaxID=187272 RepID=Q0A6Y1_ALKEH|nr:ABC transporter substrate-binding protein [Alkalilimnicola ehrlichii]ABI57406.1 TRAP transporter solute receptor, TAXI family [Alkalilimnicola ehrlichii MLHE-1]